MRRTVAKWVAMVVGGLGAVITLVYGLVYRFTHVDQTEMRIFIETWPLQVSFLLFILMFAYGVSDA